MHSHSWQPLRVLAVAALATAFAVPQHLPAQTTDHVVSPRDLNQATQDATRTRQQNADTLRGFLSSTQAKKALESAHMNPQQVQNAVSGLSDQELAQLASRATRAHNDFAAGNMSDHDLLIILIAIAALILIIVAVH
jgi:Flp pilus assembly protein TadB